MSTPQPTPEILAADSLTELEDRIRRTVELVAGLKAERDSALADLADVKAKLAELAPARKAVAELDSAREEVIGLRAERKQVRLRIEKLLAQMDQVAGR